MKYMPAAKNPEGRVRSRKYSIVIHDVLPSDKERVNAYAKSLDPSWYLVAIEEYSKDQEVRKTDHHIHLFIQHINQISKWQHLKQLQKEFPNSRVQVDHGKGCFDQCHKYLTNPDKSKDTDTDIICDDRPAKVRHHTMIHAHSKICRKTCSRCAYLRWYRQALDNHRGPIPFKDEREYVDPIISKQPANKLWI
jgi:hypothetical protein